MKKSVFYSALVAGMLALSFHVSAIGPLSGSSNTEFGNYTLTSSEDAIEFDGKTLETYDLTYANVKTPVKIGVDVSRNCKNYIVRYPSFEIQYVCNKQGLGAKRIYEGFESVHPKIVNALLDDTQLNYQARIVGQMQSDEEALQLIACYFPRLIKKEIRELKSL